METPITAAFSIPTPTFQWLARQAELEGCTIAEVIREVLIGAHETEKFLQDMPE